MMNRVYNWWNGAPQPPVSAVEGIDKLQESIESLQSRKLQTMQKIHKLKKEAQTLYNDGQLEQAKVVMARKRILESQLKTLDGQLMKLEQTASAVESTAMSVDMAAAMKDSSIAMGGMLQKTSVSEIEGIHDDLEEHMEDAQLLADTLSRPFGGSGVLIDDEDPFEELKLPSVPREKIADDQQSPVRLPIQDHSSRGVGSREKLAPL